MTCADRGHHWITDTAKHPKGFKAQSREDRHKVCARTGCGARLVETFENDQWVQKAGQG